MYFGVTNMEIGPRNLPATSIIPYIEFLIANTTLVNSNFVDILENLLLLNNEMNLFWRSKLLDLIFIASTSLQAASCLHLNFTINTRATRKFPQDMRLQPIIGNLLGEAF